jgi:hypothetical protein
VRYDWNLTPEERYGRFIVFDPASGSLVRLGKDDDIYEQNNKNIQPRVGFAWDPFRSGKTSVRGAYAVLVDQPMTSVVLGTAAKPASGQPPHIRRHDPAGERNRPGASSRTCPCNRGSRLP